MDLSMMSDRPPLCTSSPLNARNETASQIPYYLPWARSPRAGRRFLCVGSTFHHDARTRHCHGCAADSGTASTVTTGSSCGEGGSATPLTVTHLFTALGLPFSGVAHTSPSDEDETLSSTSVPVAVASVCSESSNSSSSSFPSSSLESTLTPLLPCICGIIGDIGIGNPSTGGGTGGGSASDDDVVVDRADGGCELMYSSGLGMVISGRNVRLDLF